MRVALISDTHLEITTEKQLRRMFEQLAAEDFDILVMAGDFCGNFRGGRCTKRTFRMAREFFPDKPILACLGNHDLWEQGQKSGSRPSLTDWREGYEEILRAKLDYKIHLFEEDGIYRQDGFTFVGHGLWYGQYPAHSNDFYHMPIGVEGSTHNYLTKRWTTSIDAQLAELDSYDLNLVFVSHFPIIDIGLYDVQHAGPGYLGELLYEKGFRRFLNGHTHDDRNGPLRRECGSDYSLPRYKIIDL